MTRPWGMLLVSELKREMPTSFNAFFISQEARGRVGPWLTRPFLLPLFPGLSPLSPAADYSKHFHSSSVTFWNSSLLVQRSLARSWLFTVGGGQQVAWGGTCCPKQVRDGRMSRDHPPSAPHSAVSRRYSDSRTIKCGESNCECTC